MSHDCAISELARLLATRGRLDFGADEIRLVRQAVADGCVPDPLAGPTAYQVFAAIVKARAGKPLRGPQGQAAPADPAPATRPRTLATKEKRAVIAERLRATPDASNRAIARILGVNDKTVANIRRAMAGSAEIPQGGTTTK
jgi:hypothetical protein